MTEQEQNTPTRSFNLWIPLMLFGMMGLGVYVGYILGENQAHRTAAHGFGSFGEGGATIDEVLNFIEERYVDSVNRDTLKQEAIDAMLQRLDPHSSYIPAQELENVNDMMEGQISGVGIRFYQLRDTVLVLQTIPDGPAAKAGILPGDRLLTVGDSAISGQKKNLEQLTSLLRGPNGTDIKVGYVRDGQKNAVPITRGEVPVKSIECAYMLDKETGYIKISRFSGKTYVEFMTELERLVEKEGLKDLVIDVRENPGGFLDAATKILNELFPSAQLLVYTQGRNGQRREYKSQGQPLYTIRKVAVLIDENSASASEILAGALQDHDRGLLVGRRSYGKGLVQEQYDLSDGSALRLTVARYYTPSGRCIQKPYTIGEEQDYSDDLEHRFAHGELSSVDSIKIGDTTAYFTTAGRKVFGGGGIMPDIFTPIGKELQNKFYIEASGYVSEYAYDYWERNRKQLKTQYPTLDAFQKGYIVDAALLGKLQSWLLKETKLQPNSADLTLVMPLFQSEFKAALAGQLYGETARFKTLLPQDVMLNTAWNALKDDNFRKSKMNK